MVKVEVHESFTERRVKSKGRNSSLSLVLHSPVTTSYVRPSAITPTLLPLRHGRTHDEAAGMENSRYRVGAKNREISAESDGL